MHIFQAEINDGLEKTIAASNRVSCASLAEKGDDLARNKSRHIKALASIEDSDLYYVQSILVTSSWNKNDDIFDKIEMWNAKNTPEDKPTNLEHDENTIIGHITSNWAITEDGVLIDENTPIENLPNKYHILTGSVIYKAFSSENLRSRSQKLIEQIEAGNKYVSMECFFKDFDYGLINKETGEFQKLSRNESTAYLTKYLRSYGGLGEHENYKIGRILKNITFSGKGFVDRPANTDSIIFSKNEIMQNFSSQKNSFLKDSGVLLNKSISHVETTDMNLEQQLNELANKVSSLASKDCAETVKEVYATVNDLNVKNTDLKNSLDTAESKIANLTSEMEALAATKESLASAAETQSTQLLTDMESLKLSHSGELESIKNTHAEEIAKIQTELQTALDAIAAYKKKEEEMMKKEKTMKRVGSLLGAGLNNEQANDAVAKFENLDDSLFDNMVALLASNLTGKTTETVATETEKTEASKTESRVDEVAALEEAEIEPSVNLSVGGEDTSVLDTRAALIEYVCARLGKTTK
jgi:hypothetical protein